MSFDNPDIVCLEPDTGDQKIINSTARRDVHVRGCNLYADLQSWVQDTADETGGNKEPYMNPDKTPRLGFVAEANFPLNPGGEIGFHLPEAIAFLRLTTAARTKLVVFSNDEYAQQKLEALLQMMPSTLPPGDLDMRYMHKGAQNTGDVIAFLKGEKN